MLTPHQWQTISDWIKFAKLMSLENIARYTDRIDIDADLKAEVLTEQHRRAKELGKLEKAIEEEARLQRKGAN